MTGFPVSPALRCSKPVFPVSIVEVVRDVDHDRIRPKEKARLETQGGLTMQQPLPPAMGDERGEHDGDRSVGIAFGDTVDVLEDGRHEGTVWRLDDIEGYFSRPSVPALAELRRAVLARRDVHGLDRWRDRTRESNGAGACAVEPPDWHDDDRRTHRRYFLIEALDDERVLRPHVVPVYRK